MAKITAGSAVKYIILPGIIPRIRELFFSGFGLLAFYIAMIYGKARLLPFTHPYLNHANIGTFGMRHVVFAAWNNLDFKWKNSDQIILFFAVLSGIFLVFTYIFAAFFFLITAPAMAGGYNLLGGGMFTNAYPRDDIAFMMLDRMLGIPGIYNSRVVTTAEFGPMPSPFHSGLHTLFAYFSWAMFAVAVMILLYFIVDIVLETTITGSPFGKHFENIWVPIRIVFALGLLIPVSYGLNSAQWITLYVAKIGSNFATNGWIAFNRGMDNPLGANNAELISVPVTPDFVGLAKDIFTVRACKDVDQRLEHYRRAAEQSAASNNDQAADSNASGDVVVTGYRSTPITAFFIDNNRAFKILANDNRMPGKNWPEDYQANFINLYLEGLRFYNSQDIKIVFGRYNAANLNKYPGGVEPICGEILIPNMLPVGQKIPTGDITNADINDGILIGASHMFAVLKMVYSITKEGWGEDAVGEEQYNHYLMKAATDRYYYQETSQGRKVIQDSIEEYAGDDTFNARCPHDTDNDHIDDEGEEMKFDELGLCEGPVANQFFVNLAEKYQRYFSYGPIMGYDYYTGNGQEILDERCATINCSRVVSGAVATCERMSRICTDTRNGYSAYKPPPGDVYYRSLGQENPFTINRSLNSDLFKYGWGGAGIWYKYIAEKNGGLMSASNTLPRLTHYPKLMETVAEQRAANDQNVGSSGCEKYNPTSSSDTPITLPSNFVGGAELAKLYYNLCKNLQQNEYVKLPGTDAQKSGNPMLDIVNALFGTSHLYSFRENSAVNPMAQMVSLGRALLDKAIQNVMIAAGGSAIGGLASLFGNAMGSDGGAASALAMFAGQSLSAIAKMMVGGATLSLTAGVLLFYVMPMLPFMYFFFAVATWVKSVFEALVGVPLWALAHLRLDGGPSFAGKAATGGYFMLLEIAIRPIITLIALVATLIIFNALANILNVTWGLVTNNLVGYDPYTQLSNNKFDVAYWRPKIDQFFFTICYIIFMYMLATSVFKLIDLIPDSVMRWIDGMKSFGSLDSSDQDVQAISQTVAFPTYIGVQKITGSTVDLIYQVPSGIGGLAGQIKEMGKPQTDGER